MGEARRPEGLAQHHRTAQHQGGEHTTAVGAGLPQQGLGHAATQIRHRRSRPLQHLEILHLQLGEGPLASQSRGRGRQ